MLPCPKLPSPSRVLPEMGTRDGEGVDKAGAELLVSTQDGSEKGTREWGNGAGCLQIGGDEKEEGGGRTIVGIRLSNR